MTNLPTNPIELRILMLKTFLEAYKEANTMTELSQKYQALVEEIQ